MAMLGVSRGNVRLAIDALAAEGLVERIPNRGARVRVISTDEAVAITEARMALEALIARKAAERITAAQAERLRAHLATLRGALEAGDLLKYSALIQRLHELVRDVAAQPVAARPGRPAAGPAGPPPVPAVAAARAAAGQPRASSPPSSTRSSPATPTGPRPPPSPTSAASSPRCPSPPPEDPHEERRRHRSAPRRRRRRRARSAGSASPPCTRRSAGSATSARSSGPAWSGARIGGTAVTVLCWPGDNLMIHVAVEQCRPGDVLVVATNSPSHRRAVRRAVRHRAGRTAGCAGVVLGRGVRDVAELREMGFPAWSRGGQRAGHGQGDGRRGQRARRPRRADHPPGRRRPRRRRRRDGRAARRRRRGADRRRRPAIDKEAASRAAFQQGELGLDRYGLRDKLPDFGIEYVALREVGGGRE